MDLIIGALIIAALAVPTLWLLRHAMRVDAILEQLRQQNKILQDIRTETWHTREACRTLADLNREP